MGSRSTPPSPIRRGLVLFALALGACGEDAPPAAHVHLVPFAASAAGAPAEGEPAESLQYATQVVDQATQRFAEGPAKRGSSPTMAPWTVIGGKLVNGRAWPVVATRTEPVALELDLAALAASGASGATDSLDDEGRVRVFNAIEIDLVTAAETEAHTTVTFEDGDEVTFTTWLVSQPHLRKYTLDLPELAAIAKGRRVARVRVEPAAAPPRDVEVLGIRLAQRAAPLAERTRRLGGQTPDAYPNKAFWWPGDPFVPFAAGDPAAGAQGWVELQGVRRLVWPQLAGQALVAHWPAVQPAKASAGSASPAVESAAPGIVTRAQPPEGPSRLVVRAWSAPAGYRVQQKAADERGDAPRAFVRAFIDGELVAEDVQPFAGQRDAHADFELELPALRTPAASASVQAKPALRVELGTTASVAGGPALGAYWEAPRLVPAAHGTRPAPARPNILVVTLDTTRADFAAVPAIAPNLHALGGLAFTNAYSTSNTTTPSHASLFTGLMPHEHGAIAVGKYVLAEEAVTLAELLRASGYRTAAFTNVEHLDAEHGFAQGFDLYFEGGRWGSLEGLFAALETEAFVADAEAPFFVWLHLFDPHAPYVLPRDMPDAFAPARDAADTLGVEREARLAADVALPELGATNATIPEWARRNVHLQHFPADENLPELVRHYAEGVHHADALLGRVVRALEGAGELDDTLIAVTADHGESLGEAGVWANHAGLFPANLRVPLVLRLPRAFHDLALTPAQLAAPVSNHDLFPTLLELLRLDDPRAPGTGHTRSLLRPDPARVLWFEADRLGQAAQLIGDELVIATLRKTRLFNDAARSTIEPGTGFAFDLATDPRAERDLMSTGDPADPRMATWLERIEAAATFVTRGANAADLGRALSPAEQKRLAELGYL